MKSEFGPYLSQVLPSVLSMAAPEPAMSVQGNDTMSAITDVLNEVTPETGEAKTANVMTDEIEEKDVAI